MQEVTVTTTIISEGSLSSANLMVDVGSGFTPITLFDDGSHNDGAAFDSVYGAIIPAQPDGTLIQYYVTVEDDLFNTIVDPASSPVTAYSYRVSAADCCGQFTLGYPGNTDCTADGKRNLADITRLIDRVYINKVALCCEANGNVDTDLEGKLNLSDITLLIDHVYISKDETAPCI